MQEQYDRKKAELEQKLLREKAELAKVNRDFHPFTKKKTNWDALPICLWLASVLFSVSLKKNLQAALLFLLL